MSTLIRLITSFNSRIISSHRHHIFKYYASTVRCFQDDSSSSVSTKTSSVNEANIGNAGSARAKTINKAMLAYLERAEAHNKFMSNEISEFEIGKRHLANIMGVSLEDFSQDDIDAAIEYLLPSGIFDKKARPKLKHPTEILPMKKAAQFGSDGRPFHTFFYTGKPNYTQTMHDLAWKLERLKELEDSKGKDGKTPEKLILIGSDWVTKKDLESRFQEKLKDAEYDSMINLLEFISTRSHALEEREAIFEYRRLLQTRYQESNLPPMKRDENGRIYQEAKGYRRDAMASLRLYESGSGKFRINGLELLEYFPQLPDRRQIVFPLHLTGKLDSVDFVASVERGGHSGQAGAIRHALSLALQSFVDKETGEKMRLAGLLTRDPRVLERQKPGMSGARRRYTWKKR